MTNAQKLEQIFGVPFTEQPNLQALRQFHAPNAYCCDDEGKIIGLCAGENEWTDLTIPADFQYLQYLNLSDNSSLQRLRFDGGLPGLRYLDVSDCKLAEFKLPEGFYQLEWLDVSRNQLKYFVPLGKYPALKHLDASNNELVDFPANLLDKFPVLERIYLKKNPLGDAKKTAVDKQGNCLAFMRRFRAALDKGATTNKEYKVLLVGNGGVGKTCLVERLVYNRFEEKYDSTEGISLEQYAREDFPYVLNLWDFGGQDIYHATHRLFMQSNAIYLLLWDEKTRSNRVSAISEGGRTNEYDNYPLDYWLYYIEHQSGKSPVIVVKTKAGEDDAEHPQRAALRTKYKDAFASLAFLHVDSKLPDWTDNGYNRLLFEIKEAIFRFKQAEELPKSWADLRQYLRESYRQGIKILSVEEYQDIASDYGIEDPMEVLTDWLVPSGVVFYRAGYFNDTILLDQAWAIDAVYTLFNRKEGHYHRICDREKGKFSGRDLADIWTPKKYSQAEQELFVHFMLSCELCFEIEWPKEKHRHIPFAERQFIAPQLMPETPPASVEFFKDMNRQNGLYHVRYTHSFLHYGIIQSFIVRTQSLAQVKDIWRNGILLKEEGVYALVQAGKREIQVAAPEAGLPLLEKVRNLLEELQGDRAEEMVSLNGEDYVHLQELKNSEYELIPTVDNGKMLPTKDFAVFLDRKPQQKFDPPKPAILPKEKMRQVQYEHLPERPSTTTNVPAKIELDDPPLRILFLAADPLRESPISWQNEIGMIRTKAEKLLDSDNGIIYQKEKTSLDILLESVIAHEPHILHFCGHGRNRKIEPDGTVNPNHGLVLHDNNHHQPRFVNAADLYLRFKRLKRMANPLQLVFLNACHSYEEARAISRHGIFTVGAKNVVISSAAQRFAAAFYWRLFNTFDPVLAMKMGVLSAETEDEDVENLMCLFYLGEEIPF
jgi:hypothetical protein